MQSVWENRRHGTGHCENCPGCDSPYPLGGLGSHDADLMLVAMEPAYNVDDLVVDMDMEWDDAKPRLELERKSSSNPLWRHMENVALAAGCEPLDLYFTNLVKCDDGSSFEERLGHCRGYFGREVGIVDPKVLLLHGTKVVQAVFEMFDIEYSDSLGSIQGDVFETSNLTLVPLYHWGYAYRQNSVTEYNSMTAKTVSTVLR